ncbi:MAG: tyrosine-type recombinase/integrase [Nitrospirota bacterium]|nr:tyrosine-type recombinase/integrase [Nitrospirota bacterium]
MNNLDIVKNKSKHWGGRSQPIYKLCKSFSRLETLDHFNEEDLFLLLIKSHERSIGPIYRDLLFAMKDRLETDEPIHDLIGRRFGITKIIRVGFTLWPVAFRNYLSRQASLLTKKRIIIREASFFNAVFNAAAQSYRAGANDDSWDDYRKHMKCIYEVIGDEERKQRVVLPLSNSDAMRLDLDLWTVFWTNAETSLQSATFDFSVIRNHHFKIAFKRYLAKKRWFKKVDSFRSNNIVGMVARALNFLSENAGVSYPAAVSITDVRKLLNYLSYEATSYKGKKLKMASIRGHFKVLNQMWDYLIQLEEKVLNEQPTISTNPFRSVSFKNMQDYYDSAQYIAEEVVEQLLLHRLELPDDVCNCLVIMMGQGLRYQEASLLEEGCLTYDDDLGMHILRFVSPKILKKRRKRGLPDYHEIGVKDLDVVNAIHAQERLTADLRLLAQSKLIFLRKTTDYTSKISVLSATGFTLPVRMLIAKHSITDHDGNIWDFNSHQCRKTVAVNMVENKASPIEVRQFLGHLSQRTTDSVYAEVRKMNLATMNHEFFEKKFMTKISEEHLSQFSEEERKVLYAEFALGEREVELGQCIKHASEGPCGKRVGRTNCAICTYLCTGPKYEAKWRLLFESQKREVAEFIAVYKKSGISEEEYRFYREYQKAEKLLAEYGAALNKILDECSN